MCGMCGTVVDFLNGNFSRDGDWLGSRVVDARVDGKKHKLEISIGRTHALYAYWRKREWE